MIFHNKLINKNKSEHWTIDIKNKSFSSSAGQWNINIEDGSLERLLSGDVLHPSDPATSDRSRYREPGAVLATPKLTPSVSTSISTGDSILDAAGSVLSNAFHTAQLKAKFFSSDKQTKIPILEENVSKSTAMYRTGRLRSK